MTKQNNLTFNEVCQVLGKSKRTVSRYIKARKLNPEKIKSQKDVTMQIIALINQKGGVGLRQLIILTLMIKRLI